MVLCTSLMIFCMGGPRTRGAAADEVSIPVTPAGPEVAVRPVEGAEARGKLVSLDGQTLSLRGPNGKPLSWSVKDIRSVEMAPAPQNVVETPPFVLLANGDELAGPIEQADEDTLTLNWTAVDPHQSMTLPLETVRCLVLQQPEDELERIRVRRVWAFLEPAADQMISINNTYVDGKFLGLQDGQIQLDSTFGKVSTAVGEVLAVVMNSELLSSTERPESYWLVSFRDGSLLTLSALRLNDSRQLSGQTTWGADLAFPLAGVTRMQLFGARVVPVSELTPAKYEFTPYLTQQYPLVANRNVKGGRLRLRGTMYATGLGVSSKSEVTYDLSDGGYASFESVIGVDDMTGGQGNVTFAVELDGQRVYESQPLGGRSPAETVGPLDVTGAGQLKLIVDFGFSGNIQDVADWCDPVLIKPGDGS